MDHYILEGKTPVKVDHLTWARWFETADRTVKRDYIGEIMVSTVFMGLDHRFNRNGPPILFETMIFGGVFDGYQTRYSNWVEAEKGHGAALNLVDPPTVLDAEFIEFEEENLSIENPKQ